MSPRLPVAALSLSGLLAAAVWAAPPPPGALNNPEITPAEVAAHVGYLASDELAGRGSGTSGNNLAGDYLAARFAVIGLQPAGEFGSYFQKFPVFTGVKLGARNELTFQQQGKPTKLRVKEEFMPLSFTKNGSVTAPLVFAGYGISQPKLGYDDYKGLDVRGKIVVVLRYTPDGDDQGKFGPYAQLTYKTMTARDKGAAGILLVTGPGSKEPENLGRLTTGSSSTDCGIPAAFVRRSFIEKALQPGHASLTDLQTLMAHGSPKSFAMPWMRVTLRAQVDRQTAQTRNVIGLLPGSDPKLRDEYLVIGAHYDHLGMGGEHSLDSSGQPAIHHGADDNASGTAGVLELAQYFAANPKKIGRSILFMGFSGEEIGLLGSNYWTKRPTIPLERIAAMINLDMIGRMRNDTVSVMGAGSSPGWEELLESVNGEHKLTLKTGGTSGFGGSDQQSFYAKEIPVLFFFTGVHPDYHRPSDTAEKIEAEGEAKLLRFVADTAAKTSWLTPRPAFARSADQETAPGPSFRVYLGTIPDYAEEVEGVALQGVREGSPAEKGGLKAGDILVEFDGKKIRNVQEYTTVLGTAKPDQPIQIVVLRKGARVTLMVTPSSRR